MILLELFWSFFQVGLFSIGGGYAALPLIQDQIIGTHQWLSAAEFTDLLTISQMTPGPIAINAATFVGIKIAGIPGALVATFGCVLAPAIIVAVFAALYFKYQKISLVQGVLQGLRPAIVGLIGSAAVTIFLTAWQGIPGVFLNFLSTNWIAVLLSVAGFIVLRKFKLSPIWIMLGCGAAGGIIYTVSGLTMI